MIPEPCSIQNLDGYWFFMTLCFVAACAMGVVAGGLTALEKWRRVRAAEPTTDKGA